MNLNLNNIFSFIKEKKLYLIIVFFVVFLIFSDFSFAQGTPAGASSGTNTGGAKTTDLLDSISKGIRWLGTFFSTFLALLTYLTAMFLSPEWMNGKLFNITDKLKEIWILVSNIVYFVFAIILIGIAFMNIVGISADKFQLKQTLPKFIVGILIVPFSWFIVNFILTISAILTINSLTLPFDTFEDYDKALDNVKIPKACTLDFRELSKSGGKDDPNKREEGSKVWECPHENGDLISVSKLIGSGTSAKSIFGLVGTYTYGIIGIEGIDKLKKFDLDKIFVAGDIVVKLLFDALFVIVYCILIVALGLVLMVRGIRLWIYMMLSPLFGIMYFLGKNSGGGEGFFGKFNIKEFFALAMVPVYSMLALSFGMLFLYIVGSGLKPSPQNSVLGIQIIPEANDVTKLTLDKNNGPTLTIKGAASSPNFTGYFTSILGQGFSVIGSLILKIFGVVVLWGAIMAALRSSNITKAIVEPLHSFGKSVGDIAMKSPQYMPIFGGQSMQSMSKIAGKTQGVFDTRALNQSKEFTSKIPFFSQAEFASSMQELTNEIKQAGSAKEVKKVFEKFRKLDNMTRDRFTEGMNQLNESLRKNGSGMSEYAPKNNYNGFSSAATGFQKINEQISEIAGGYIDNISKFTEGNVISSSSSNSDKKDKKENGTDKIKNSNNSNTAKTDDKTNELLTKLNATLKDSNSTFETDIFDRNNSFKIIDGLDIDAVFKKDELKKITEEEFKKGLKAKGLGKNQIDELVKYIGDNNISFTKF